MKERKFKMNGDDNNGLSILIGFLIAVGILIIIAIIIMSCNCSKNRHQKYNLINENLDKDTIN